MTRREQRDYFTSESGVPAPLVVETRGRVRFEEVDSLGIVWHGRYPSFLEDGRAGFGRKFGLGYLDMFGHGFLAPVVSMHLEYHTPLRFLDEFTVRTVFHYNQAVKFNIEYQVLCPGGDLAATGYTTQLLTDLEFKLLLTYPPFMEDFRLKWREGRLP